MLRAAIIVPLLFAGLAGLTGCPQFLENFEYPPGAARHPGVPQWTTYYLRAPAVWITLPEGSKVVPEDERFTRIEAPACEVTIDARSSGPSSLLVEQGPQIAGRLEVSTLPNGSSIEGVMRDGSQERYSIREYRTREEGFVVCRGAEASDDAIDCMRRICRSLQMRSPPFAVDEL